MGVGGGLKSIPKMKEDERRGNSRVGRGEKI